MRKPAARRTSAGRRLASGAALLFALPALAAGLKDRLTEPYLSRLQAAGREARAGARPAERSGDYLDVRCILHAHSRLSHDSRGTEAQITAAAKAAGVRAVFMTEHPTADGKWFAEGLSGEKDGVLFVPGAELSDGLLLWRSEKAGWTPEMRAAEALEKVRQGGGTAFIAHPEERKSDADWELPPFMGMEIYNCHADAKDSGYEEFLRTFRAGSPLEILSLLNTLKKYPQESYAAIFDEQAPILKRWDALNARFLGQGRRVVGIAANDSHQNVGISMVAAEDGVRIEDALGKTVGVVPAKKLPLLLLGPLKPGATLLSHTFDPYEVSFRYVSTHLLAREVSENALFEALDQGRAYVAFDWMRDPSGFRYSARVGGRTVEMGEDCRAADHPVLTVRPGRTGEIRLLRNGQEVRREEGAGLRYEAREPGVYRVEVWLALGAEQRPWIYSNPVYVLP
jgi:hypothetical protein